MSRQDPSISLRYFLSRIGFGQDNFLSPSPTIFPLKYWLLLFATRKSAIVGVFLYAAKMNKGQYEGHFTPAGATVLPVDSDGKNGWKFHYNGWQADEFDRSTYVRDDAKFGNIKPKSRAGYLDAGTLRKLGLSSERMSNKDPFFNYCSP